MTGTSITIVVVFLLVTGYAYLVFPVWVAIECASSPAFSTRTKTLWFIACVVFAPVGSWAFCILTPQRRHFRVTSWISLAGTIALVWFVTQYTITEAGLLRERISAMAARVRTAQMDPDGVQRAIIMADLDTLKSETHGGVLAFKQNAAAAAIVDLLEVDARDGHITLFEAEEWVEQFKSRQTLGAAALARRVQAGTGDSP